VVEFGRDFDEAKHEAFRVASVEGLHFVPSFHRDLVAGVASYALELFRSGPDSMWSMLAWVWDPASAA